MCEMPNSGGADCMCFSSLWIPLSLTQMEQIISPFTTSFSVQYFSLLAIMSFGKTSPPGVGPGFSFYVGFVWLKKLVGKWVGRRKRSIEHDPRHGWLCSQAEENSQEARRQTSLSSSELPCFPPMWKREPCLWPYLLAHKVYLHF